MEIRSNLIDCAIIKVDITKKSPTYEQDGSALRYGFSYSVPIQDIEETMKFLKVAYEEVGLPYSRIYLSGFALLTQSSIWSKERIIESLRNQYYRINNLTASTSIHK